MAKQSFEYIRMLEFCTSCRPAIRMSSAFRPFSEFIVFRNVYCFVKETHLFIRCLVLKCISIFYTKVHNEIDNIRSCFRNLYRIRFDMNNREASLLNLILKKDHEKRSTLCYHIVNVSRIAARIRKFSSGQSKNSIDRDLECIAHIIGNLLLFL